MGGDEGASEEVEALRRRCAELEAKALHLDVVNFFASSLLYTQTDLDDILWDVANSAVARLGLEDCVIYLLDPSGAHLVQRAAYGPKNPRGREILAPITIPVGRGIVGAVAATGQVARIPDTRVDPRYITDDSARLSELAIPIFFNDEVIGVLDTEHSELDFFTDAHEEILTTIASMTASRVGRALLDEGLRRANAELEVQVAHRTRELSAAVDRSERLLLNILPEPIARRLSAGEERIAESFDEVTVLFADLVGFTLRSAETSPEALVELLGHVFTALDAISDRFGVEKIKTIGDAYMVVAGVPTPRVDHLEAMAETALAILGAVEELGEELGIELQMRIGMHSGPVVAGIIGTRKFAYDLWGDTVNTASRMESHGLPGRIHVAESTYLALRDRFRFAERGEVEVKGLGAMRTYFLLGR
ncbi:MAG: GAF domain-containing protein [Myxococcales bacterium]|nr:GAF domain-containing protein [Myxococcales bacterium]MCB9702929.1 GAF domain-containing protein [Myxococcales bacterium]